MECFDGGSPKHNQLGGLLPFFKCAKNTVRYQFAKLICSVPPEAIKHLKDLADAENLLEAAFGKGFGDEQS